MNGFPLKAAIAACICGLTGLCRAGAWSGFWVAQRCVSGCRFWAFSARRFCGAALAAIWWALERSFRDGEIVEDLAISDELVTLTRHGPRGKRQDWQANPHWVRLTLHATGGPVPQYLTMKGQGREVELGAFLTAEERRRLCAEITRLLRS
jgi:uncharacterized membrane protein